ncbi:MFS transporter [Thermostilla marina]
MSDSNKSLSLVERFYDFLIEDSGGRVCKDIPAKACRHVPRNFFLIGFAQILTRLADELANAKTVLPWLLSTLGASGGWIGMLVPVRESMSMLPQLMIADFVGRTSYRKRAWIVGAAAQAAALIVMAIAAMVTSGAVAGAAVLGALFVFSTARGVCSVASKDIVGRTIPKTRRGRLNGYTVASAGVLALAVGSYLTAFVRQESSPALFAILLGTGAVLWGTACLLMGQVREPPAETTHGQGTLRAVARRLVLLKEDPRFRVFILVRALFVSTALAGPYYVLIARESKASGSLGAFIVAAGLASAVSSAFWGRFADVSSRKVMMLAGATAAVLGFVFVWATSVEALSPYLGYLAPAAFFILAIAHSGMRIGRKTYVIDLATRETRIDYVAVANTLIGVIVLAGGLFGLLTPLIGPEGMLLLFSGLSATGVLLAFRMPETERD